MAKKTSTTKAASKTKHQTEAVPYKHSEAKSLMRPEVGAQAQFKKKKSPKTYRYDSSLSPSLDWDAKNSSREAGQMLIKQVLDAKSLEEAKAERLSTKASLKRWQGTRLTSKQTCSPSSVIRNIPSLIDL